MTDEQATDEKAENDIELWGLIRNNGTAKPGYVAFQVGARYFSEAVPPALANGQPASLTL